MKKGFVGIAILITVLLLVSLYFYQNTYQTPVLQKEILEDYVAHQEKQPPLLQPIHTTESIAYALQDGELHITYDDGVTWTKVPVVSEQLFAGEYNGNKQELIDGSFRLKSDHAIFLTIEGSSLYMTYSVDQGDTWEEAVVTDETSGVRFRKVDFLTDTFGYVVFTHGRVMAEEGTQVFITNDGGATWEKTADLGVTRMLADGAFIDETTGFLSFGTISPEYPTLYVTDDAGETWTEAHIDVPEHYEDIFLVAEIPERIDGELHMFVHQGPNGDYLGGHIKGEFVSTDGGLTWTFLGEVDPDEEA